MRIPTSPRSRPTFGRAIALVAAASVMLFMVHAASSTTLDVRWVSEAQSGESESRVQTESSDCRSLPTGSVRSRSRQVPLVSVPRAAFQAVRHLLRSFDRQPARVARNPAWPPPLRC